MNDRLQNIMSNLFEVSINDINEDISIENCSEWDSLRHMHLIHAIEDEFEISLTDDDVIKIRDFKSIIGIIESHI